MDLLTLLGVVALAGGVGGAFNGWQINFFRSDLNTSDPAVELVQKLMDAEGKLMDAKGEVAPHLDMKEILSKAIETPRSEKWGSFFFNIVAGALAAAVSWSAYGPYALADIFGGVTPDYGLTLIALTTALVTGFGGPRWLTNERDKALLKQAAENAAGICGAETTRGLLQNATPKQASAITQAIKDAKALTGIHT